MEPFYEFNNKMAAQPDMLVFSADQNVGIIASTDDVLWFDIQSQNEVDIDDVYQLGDIKSLLYYDEKFYVLANKYQRKLGYFLLEIDTMLYGNIKKPKYVIKWENKLAIGDAGLDLI